MDDGALKVCDDITAVAALKGCIAGSHDVLQPLLAWTCHKDDVTRAITGFLAALLPFGALPSNQLLCHLKHSHSRLGQARRERQKGDTNSA
jgi:hypothetical protein